MSDEAFFVWVVGGIAFAALLVLCGWIGIQNWRECRATPHTALYCFTRGD